jgi:hypothetical protein
MKTNITRPDGTRLVIEPSHTFGNVRLFVLGSEEIITIPAGLAGLVCQAIEAAATMIEEGELPPELPASALTPTARAVIAQQDVVL